MKTIPILLSLAISATAQQLEGAASTVGGNIRASKVITDKTKRNAAVSSAVQEEKTEQQAKNKLPMRPSKNDAKREKRSQRKALGDGLHAMLFNEDRSLKEAVTKKDKKTQEKNAKTTTPTNKGQEDRELKKAKSDKGGGSWGGSSGGYDDDWRGGGGGRYDDDYRGGDGGRPDPYGDDRFSNDDRIKDDDWRGGGGGGNGGGRFDGDWGGSSGSGGKSGKDWGGSWSGGSGGKSGKDSGSWGGSGGKSGKGGWSGSGKGGYGGGGYSGKSGKGYGGGSCDGEAYVTITNLSYQQSFSEIFVMTHTKEATWKRPIFIFGNRTNDALAELAQDAKADGLMRRYEHRHGVEQTKVFRDFRNGIRDEHFLRGGARARLRIRTSGDGHRLSIAAGLPFTNDGAIVLEGAHIYDGAEYWLPVIDVGAEGNIQTCWSVAAEREDFPSQSDCYSDDKDDLSDLNDNSIPGENFVSLHRGMHDLNDDKDDLQDLLFFPECEDFDLDKSDETDRFAHYFYEVGYDDEWLLCSNWGGGSCNLRNDDDFLDYIDRSPIHDGEDDRYIRVAKDSDDFDQFCDDIKTANSKIEDALTILEPWLFDWRSHVAHVQINCGLHRDDHFYGDWRQ
ncbi:hypothetical protein ACHAXR_003862 [Thalassiosira sp. AJA248-18]